MKVVFAIALTVMSLAATAALTPIDTAPHGGQTIAVAFHTQGHG